MRNCWFLVRKGGIFRSGKEIEELRGGVHRYAAQARPKIDAVRAEKNPFRTETNYELDSFAEQHSNERGGWGSAPVASLNIRPGLQEITYADRNS